MSTTTVHPVFAPVAPAPPVDPEEATLARLDRVDALLKVYADPTPDEWRAAYRKFVYRMVVAAHGHRKGSVPADQLRRTIKRARVTFCDIHRGYGLDPAVLFAPGRPDRAVRAILEAQEGSGDCWSASRREFVP